MAMLGNAVFGNNRRHTKCESKKLVNHMQGTESDSFFTYKMGVRVSLYRPIVRIKNYQQ